MSWRVIRLIWHLEGFFCIIPTDKQVRNVMSVSHYWKSASSEEDAISMLSILFMATVTGGTGCITDN